MTEPRSHKIAGAIKAKARELGFDLVGIASTEPSKYQHYFRQWLDDGQGGSMSYLARNFPQRIDPSTYLPGVRSAICVAMNYFVPLQPVQPDLDNPAGKIARYALGDDYHDLIKHRLFQLADWLRETAPDAQTKCCVDTAPIMEKELAARAGVGWVGKNTCLINPKIGSWLLLGEIVTTLDLPPDDPSIDRCGTCTRCIDACPTQAITEPYRLDARRCIAYLTIEHRGDLDPNLSAKFSGWLYGCDICQDVCPHNSKSPASTDPALQPRFPAGRLNLSEVLRWTPTEYQQSLRRSAMKRLPLPMLKRNAEALLKNENAIESKLKGTAPFI